MSEPELVVRDLSVRAGDRMVLEGLGLEVAAGTMTGLMGPMGGGKSTLLKYLCGRLDAGLSATCAEARHRGAPLGVSGLPALVGQRVREAAEGPDASARLAAARIAEIEAAARGGRMVCVDEPTAGLQPPDGGAVMARLRTIAARACVVVVSHNAAEVRAHCTHAALCAGGRVVAMAPTAVFFGPEAPAPVVHFLATGSIALPTPGTPQAHLAPEMRTGPAGFDLDPAPAVGPAVVIRDALTLESRAVDGAGAPASPPPRGVEVLVVLADAVVIRGACGPAQRLRWDDARHAGPAGLRQAIEIARRIEARIAAGGRVTLVPDRNPGGAAALLGVFLILRGFPPDRAFAAAQAKTPGTLLGMRVEQMLWEAEIELEMARPAG